MDRSAAKDAPQLALFDEAPAPREAASRFVLLRGVPVAYRFTRRRRRTIGLRIGEEGLSVSAPLRAPWRDIEGFIHEKEAWILEKLSAWSARAHRPVVHGESGERIPVFGREVTLDVGTGQRGVLLEDQTLRIRHPRAHRPGAVREVLVDWLKDSMLATLAPRVAHFAARLSLPVPAVTVSRAKTLWGVCTADGRIRLSWRLAHLAPELGDYVAAHEVAHLVELNHSERFWALVEWMYPHWREARARIERDAAALPRL